MEAKPIHVSEKKQGQKELSKSHPVHKEEHEKKEEKKIESTALQTADNSKIEEKKEQKKPIVKKDEAMAITNNAPISKKHSMYICSFIKNKPIDIAISQLEEVLKFKRAIPFKGEIPHRHNPGMMSGRYPINASKFFIQFLKNLKGNAIVNGLDVSKSRIYFASATWASRSAKRGGARFKRAYIVLKVREMPEAKK